MKVFMQQVRGSLRPDYAFRHSGKEDLPLPMEFQFEPIAEAIEILYHKGAEVTGVKGFRFDWVKPTKNDVTMSANEIKGWLKQTNTDCNAAYVSGVPHIFNVSSIIGVDISPDDPLIVFPFQDYAPNTIPAEFTVIRVEADPSVPIFQRVASRVQQSLHLK